MPGSRLWTTAEKHGLLPDHEIRGVFDMNLKLPGVRPGDVRRSIRKGIWLKGTSLFRSGHVNFAHLKAIRANLKVMLGLGPPSGAY
jgi:hypothetical protein